MLEIRNFILFVLLPSEQHMNYETSNLRLHFVHSWKFRNSVESWIKQHCLQSSHTQVTDVLKRLTFVAEKVLFGGVDDKASV